MLPTPESEYSQQATGARFTVRSANSPSYSLIRRPVVRRSRLLEEEFAASTERIREAERYRKLSGANGSTKEEDRTGLGYNSSSVKGQSDEKETAGFKMFSTLSHNDSAVKSIAKFTSDTSGICEPATHSHGRTLWRTDNLASRSKSLDWRSARSSDWSNRDEVTSTRRGWSISIDAAGTDERRAALEEARARVQSSLQTYTSAGMSSNVGAMSPVGHMWNRHSRGRSLPSRVRSHSGPCAGVKGGQTIMERIEMLYGSAGFSKTDDYSKARDFSSSVLPHHRDTAINLPLQRSYDDAAGRTLRQRFLSGEKSSPPPLVLMKSFTWTQKDTSTSESYVSPETSRTRENLSGEQWRGQTQGRYSPDMGVQWRKGLDNIGTRSLDRATSRYSVAAQIRAARATEEMTPVPQSDSFLRGDRSSFSRDSSWFSKRRDSGGYDQQRVNHGEEKGESNGINRIQREKVVWVKEIKETGDAAKAKKIAVKTYSADEDVFDPSPQKVTVNTTEKRKISETLSVPSVASVKNKISQFEALTQRSRSVAAGQIGMPRRALSVPSQQSRTDDGVKKSVSARAISGVSDKWEGLKERAESREKTKGKMTSAGEKHGSERSLSVDEVGLKLGRKDRDQNDRLESDSGNNSAEDSDHYFKLKSSLKLTLNGGAKKDFHINEADFSKVSSPPDVGRRPGSSELSDSSHTPSASDEDKTPTNTPSNSPFLSPTTHAGRATPTAERTEGGTPVLTQAAKPPEQEESPPLLPPLPSSSPSNLPSVIPPDVHPKRKKQVLDMDAWMSGLNTKIKVWNNDEDDYEDDDDESTQKDEDSNYDSDSGESSVTITSNMSQSDRKSFSVSLSDLCNFAGVDYESESDSDDCQSRGRRSASLSSDMSALSYVSVLPSEELDRLLEDVRSLGDNNLQDYNDVQVVVLHKEVGVGLGFSMAGGVDQNKPVTVHKVFHSGAAAQEGSIREGDQVLSINGTSLCGFLHWEALRVLRRAKTREQGVVVLRRSGFDSDCKEQVQINDPGQTECRSTETGQRLHVHLEKNSRDLGFSLEGGVGSSLEDKPLTVQKIFQGGPVQKVYPGDELLEIGGVSVAGMRRLEAWTFIRSLPPGPVDVVLNRPLKHQET